MKKCCKCHEKWPLSSFVKDKRQPDGLRSTCRSCECEQWVKIYKEKNKEKIKEKSKKRRIIDSKSLRDSYVKLTLLNKGFTSKDIANHPDLIIIQRTTLKIKRKIKSNGNQKKKNIS